MGNIIQTTHRDIAWFKQAHDLNQLQMKPTFQRNLVWTTKQKSFLIDSILNNYPVPEIYMQDIIYEDGKKEFVVVDGQQRITTCLEFINNDFVMDAKDSPTYANLTFDEITPELKKRIYGYLFVVRLLPEMSDVELREIFSRLNRNNVVLNQQELRQATYWGQFINTMNEIASNDIWRELGIFSSNDVKRMLDIEFISELTIAVIHGVQNKKLTLDKYYELYEDEFPQKEDTKYIFDLVNREFLQILPNFSRTRWSKKTDFYSLFVVFANHKDSLPLSETKRTQANEKLNTLANQIDNFVATEKMEEDLGKFSVPIIQYANSIRASSDLGARKRREDSLETLLVEIFAQE